MPATTHASGKTKAGAVLFEVPRPFFEEHLNLMLADALMHGATTLNSTGLHAGHYVKLTLMDKG